MEKRVEYENLRRVFERLDRRSKGHFNAEDLAMTFRYVVDELPAYDMKRPRERSRSHMPMPTECRARRDR